MARVVTRLRDDWAFTRIHREDALAAVCDESDWETVQVPHDWAIAGPFDRENDMERKVRKGQADVEESVRFITGRTGGLPHTGEGWYRKTLDIPVTSQGRVFRLECDGIMSHSEIYCNGTFAGAWPYGYSSFAFDLSELIRPGETNVIAVHVNNPELSSRWYPARAYTGMSGWSSLPRSILISGELASRHRRLRIPAGRSPSGRRSGMSANPGQ